MSEDQELLARISQLAGQINLHKAQPPSSQPGTNIHRSRVTRGYATWKAPRQAPYSARKRGARRHPTSHSLVLSKESSQSPANKGADGLGALQPTASYVSKQGRHRQLINSSVLDRVTQQRKQAIEESQQHKVLADDQRERQRMQQYMEGLDASQGSSTMRTSRTPSSKFHQIGLDGMTFQIMKKGRTCPKKRCGLPHVDRAGQIRKQAAQSTNTSNSSDGQKVAETNQSDISSDEDNGAETDGEDVDSDDLNDELIEGVDALGRQALAEQHDFVGF
ncbi:MAG: hypothetical protein LQ338_005892 [Usnochroma carphineum]|nr:MAG: hypothetical protein LQ338_005892 [Usnochroma carphineum]